MLCERIGQLSFESSHPLCTGEFHRLMEDTFCTHAKTGWQPLHFQQSHALLPGYLKGHSYGEYIFDWAWADFYQQHGLPYYPKLVHTLPFTPVNAPKILGSSSAFETLSQESYEFYQAHDFISSEHYLFTSPQENIYLNKLGFKIMETLQFHWSNAFRDFSDFLDSLTNSKKKMIIKERRKIASYPLEIKILEHQDLTEERMEEFYQIYLSTIDKKNSHAYLNKTFFLELPKVLKSKVFIIVALHESEVIAMSLFFKSPSALYGRYWGIKPEHEDTYKLLHFELCYYQGMEICMRENIPLFEAGAQGEHKLWRGFHPITITSAHHIKRPQMFGPIAHYIKEQNLRNRQLIESYKNLLPYKTD